LQQYKNFENRLRFDKVTESLNVRNVYGTQKSNNTSGDNGASLLPTS